MPVDDRASRPSTALAVERSRTLASRYETHVMRLGCLTTTVWLVGGIAVFTSIVEKAELAGLHSWLALALGAGGVVALRQLTLFCYRAARDNLRQHRMDPLHESSAAEDLGHLPVPLAAIIVELRALTAEIQSPSAEPDDTLDALRRWLEHVAHLDSEQKERMAELGLDVTPLVVLARLRREQGELTDFWNERAYRRLQAAVPILSHIDRQLSRGRDDVYR